MILATVEFSNGTQIHLGENGRWIGEPCYHYIVESANDCDEGEYQPNAIKARAEEVAKRLGGKVVYYLPLVNREGDGPHTIY
jgi:hypothetical protein